MGAVASPDAVVWSNGLRWVDAAHMQVRRFEEAFGEQMHAVADARHRAQLADDSELSRSWRESYDTGYEPYDPERPIRVPSFGLEVLVANELDLLAVAVRNVLRAQMRIPEEHRPAMTGQEALELLRNVTEHFDEVGGRSEVALAEAYPEMDFGGIAFTGKEIWIGGDSGIPVSRIVGWLARVRRAFLDCLAETGVAVPDDRASVVEGDDDLAWPEERLHFSWGIPRVEEQLWPREEMPDDVTEALAAMFARLRARDPAD